MLDALKNMAGGKGKTAQKQVDELEALIANAREERGAIGAMLTALATRSAKLAPIQKTLEQVTQRAGTTAEQVEALSRRLADLDTQALQLAELDKRIQVLKEAALQAEQTTERALGPDGELRKHREAVQQLSSQALQTQASIDTLKKERAALEELRTELKQTLGEVKQSSTQASAVKGDLDQIRSLATQLAQDYGRVRETSREAKDDTTAAMATIKEVEKKLGPLAALHEMSERTEERLTTLNALAEHVSHKAKALEGQQQAVEHAVVQANRLSEMVWNMDVQIAKLNEGLKQAAKAEETIGRIEKLVQDTGAQLDSATQARLEAERATSKLEKEATGLLEAVRQQIEKLALEKKEFEAFDQRLHTLQSTLGEAEGRLDALAAKDKNLVALTQKVDGLAKRFEDLFNQAEDLTRKQLALDGLTDQLAQSDELAKRNLNHMEALRQGSRDLERVRKEIQDFYKAHAEIAQIRDRLASDRVAFDGFTERMTAFSTKAPELEARLEAIMGKMTLVEEGTQKATRLGESVSALDAQLNRVAARLQFVEKLETRLNGLNELSGDVDRKFVEQLARRGELDTLKSACDGLATQMVDAQHKAEAVAALQARILPMTDQVSSLQQDIERVQARLGEVQRDEATVTEQEKHFAELLTQSRGVAAEVAERVRQMQSLSEELGRSTTVRDELLADLARVQDRQRDVLAHVEATEDQLKRTEKLFKQLDQRRSQLAFAEKKMGAFEARIAELKQSTDEFDRKIQAIAAREALVAAVKKEVESIYAISARSRADLDHVAEHRGDLEQLKASVDDLLSRIGETDERIAAIDERRKVVDEVQHKTNAIVHVLDDIRVNLETLGEQKAVVDHVSEKVAQLEFMLQEARNTIRSLQHERELAQRIEQSIAQLRTKTARPDEGKRTA